MKKTLISLMVLALAATPLVLARPHYSNGNLNAGASSVNASGANGSAVTKDAKNYQNLKGNYKSNASGSANNVVNTVSSGGANASGKLNNNLKSNYAGSVNAAGGSSVNNVNSAKR